MMPGCAGICEIVPDCAENACFFMGFKRPRVRIPPARFSPEESNLVRLSCAVKLRLTFGTVVAGVCFSPPAPKSPASIALGSWSLILSHRQSHD